MDIPRRVLHHVPLHEYGIARRFFDTTDDILVFLAVRTNRLQSFFDADGDSCNPHFPTGNERKNDYITRRAPVSTSKHPPTATVSTTATGSTPTPRIPSRGTTAPRTAHARYRRARNPTIHRHSSCRIPE